MSHVSWLMSLCKFQTSCMKPLDKIGRLLVPSKRGHIRGYWKKALKSYIAWMKKQHWSVRMCVGGTHTVVGKIDIRMTGDRPLTAGKNSTKTQPSLARMISGCRVFETKVELKLIQHLLCLEISSKDSRGNVQSTDKFKEVSMEK